MKKIDKKQLKLIVGGVFAWTAPIYIPPPPPLPPPLPPSQPPSPPDK